VVAALAAGCRLGLRDGSAGGWQRYGRVAAEPAEFLQCGGYSDFAWAGAGYSDELGWFTLSVSGPVARNVTDCAFFLSVCWRDLDHHSPISIDQSGGAVCAAAGAEF